MQWAASFCTNDFKCLSSITSLLNKLDVCTLEERRKRSCLISLCKIIHGLVDIEVNNFFNFSNETHSSRGCTSKLPEPYCKKDVLKFSFFPRIARYWNQLLPDMPHITALAKFENYLDSLAYYKNM